MDQMPDGSGEGYRCVWKILLPKGTQFLSSNAALQCLLLCHLRSHVVTSIISIWDQTDDLVLDNLFSYFIGRPLQNLLCWSSAQYFCASTIRHSASKSHLMFSDCPDLNKDCGQISVFFFSNWAKLSDKTLMMLCPSSSV